MSLESLAAFYQLDRVEARLDNEGGKTVSRLTGTDAEQVEYIESGLEAIRALTSGLSAVGHALALNDVDDKGVTKETIDRIAFLVVNLGELATVITNDIESIAHVRIHGGEIVHG